MSIVTKHPSLHFGSVAELAALKMEVKKLRLEKEQLMGAYQNQCEIAREWMDRAYKHGYGK